MSRVKIKDCFPLVNGLWTHINYDFPDIFDIEPSQLDVLFISNWGERIPAPLVKILHKAPTVDLTSPELTQLADILTGMYKHKWDKMMAVAQAEYDPIHNYYDHLEENIEYSEEVDGTKSLTGSHSNTRTDNLQEVEADSRVITDTRDIDKSTTDGRIITETRDIDKTTTDARQVQETKNLTELETRNLTELETDDKTQLETRNLSKSGNGSENDEVYGFNSSTGVGDRDIFTADSNSETGTITTTNTGTVSTGNTGTVNTTNTGTDTKVNSGTLTEGEDGSIRTTHSGALTEAEDDTFRSTHSGNITTNNTGTQTDAGSNTSSETSGNDTAGEKAREYTKTGNIGNISTQKLLNEELELWKYNFLYEMMRDVAKCITLPIYETNNY